MLTEQYTIKETVKLFLRAPIDYPELLPTVLPLIVGITVIELYFGKYTKEELGWNTSVGNSVIWATTGLTLLMTTDMTSQEKYAAYGLVGIGGLIGYLNFYHKWSDTVAFLVSSAGIVYSLAYIAVVIIKTPLPVNQATIKAAAVFVVGINILFKIIQQFETPKDTYSFN